MRVLLFNLVFYGGAFVPVAQSIGLIWPRRRWRKNVGQVRAWEFLEPIPPGLDKATFMRELERRIEHGTMALIRAQGEPHVAAEAERRFRLGPNNSDSPPVRRPTDLGPFAPSASAAPPAGDGGVAAAPDSARSRSDETAAHRASPGTRSWS